MLQDIVQSDNNPLLYLDFGEGLEGNEALRQLGRLLENYFTIGLLAKHYSNLGSRQIEKRYTPEHDEWKYVIVSEEDILSIKGNRRQNSQALAFIDVNTPKKGYHYYSLSISMGVDSSFGQKFSKKFQSDTKLSNQFFKGFLKYALQYKGKDIP